MEHQLVDGSLLTFLTAEDRDFLFKHGMRRAFGRNEILMREGDPTDHVLIMIDGWLRVTSSTKGGNELLLALRGPGDVIGDLAALHGWSRTASARSIERASVVQLRGPDFVACLHNRPSIAIAMIKQTAVRLRQAEYARMEFATLDVGKRVAAYLVRLAALHGGRDASGRLILRVPLTQQDIANQIGASRRAVARAMSVLRDRGLVASTRGHITIARLDVLTKFAD